MRPDGSEIMGGKVKHTFSIEMKSKDHLRNISISNESHEEIKPNFLRSSQGTSMSLTCKCEPKLVTSGSSQSTIVFHRTFHVHPQEES